MVIQSVNKNGLKVPLEADTELEVQISAEELHTVLQSLEGKALGIDSLPAQFFRPVIGQDLLSVLRDSLRKDQLSEPPPPSLSPTSSLSVGSLSSCASLTVLHCPLLVILSSY